MLFDGAAYFDESAKMFSRFFMKVLRLMKFVLYWGLRQLCRGHDGASMLKYGLVFKQLDVMNYSQILLYSVYSDLKTEVSRRLLGFLWWGLEPVLYMATFYVVFGVALQQGGNDYVYFLISGMVIWKWFDGSVRLACGAIPANQGLFQQIYLPKVLFVLVPVLTNTFKFLVVFLLLAIFLSLGGKGPGLVWWSLIPVCVAMLLFTFSISVFFAALLPFLQDLRQIIDNFMMLLMFMSGIFYRVNELSGKYNYIFDYNPVFHLISAFRGILVNGVVPEWSSIGFSLLCALPFGVVGYLIMRRYDRHYPKILM